ncbi:OmpA family protein [Thalassospira sp. TSL5-1]|uniref:OmpA family protein n=1 Tax=Thalassospira sp. TSL5-1 TaxID=1544451 RepID=UPI00093B5AE1|nr:OmpA family protein [Thalassospira sp. TSL5-1]
MKGNTRISAIAFAAALGTLLATSQGATAGSFSPVMPGNNVQVDLGVLDQLDDRTAPGKGFSSPDNNAPRIEIDRQLVIYPQAAPKSRFMAPQLLLNPPSATSRFDTSNGNGDRQSDGFGTVVIDGAGIVPTENATPQRSAITLNPPQERERIQLRPPVSYPARPAVERLDTPPASQPFFSRGNLGGSLNKQDLDDDGAKQIIHLVPPQSHNVDGLPRNRPATTPATADSSTSSAKSPQEAVAQNPATTLPAQGPLLAQNNAKPAVPAAPEIAKPDTETPREAPKNKMPAPAVDKAPLPKAEKPSTSPAPTKPATGTATTPQPLTQDNSVKPAPSPAPDTTTPPQKMPDQQSGTMPKPPVSKKTVQKNDPAPEPRVKPQIPARETASAPASDPASAPAKKSGPAPTGDDYSLPFAGDSFELDASAKKSLDKVIGNLAKNGDLRVQLQAYAAGESQNASKARRLSLSRALQVRSYLIDGGVRSTRIDVRALGANVPSGPADRVDIKTVQR